MTSQALGQRRLIFIAHAAEDRPLVSAIHSEIQTLFPGRFSIFNALDERSIEPSAEWRDRLRQAVTKTTLLLAVLTRNSVGKQWIYFESGGAYFQGIPVLPILGPGVNAVPDPFSSVQAVNICEVEGIRRLMNRLARLGGQDAITDRYRPERLLKKLDVLNAQSTALSGKSWAKFTEDAIRRYLQDATPGSQLSVRLVSYTGETTARTVPATISRYWRPDTDLKVSVLLKSEYDAFTIRPHAGDFNRYVRWRISRAKADWYGWMNNYKIQAHAKRPGSITLEIRDYNWEPAARALILGNREAFFGLYAMRFHTPSDRPSVDPAVDWVAARTQMVHFDSSSHLFVNDLCNWFEEAWQRSTKRTNEPYRCLVSADLWQACCKKQTQEREARREFMHWKAEARGRLETGNLGLPAEYPYERGRMIDFMASAVICGKGAGSDRSVLICEIREQGETWEGIGKSATYLDLIGIAPELPMANRSRYSIVDAMTELERIVRDLHRIEWKEKRPRKDAAALFASDFVWLWCDDSEIKIIRPEGEIVWGLWDCARHWLRKSLEVLGIERSVLYGIQRTPKGRKIQEDVFLKLPVRPLARRYSDCCAVRPEAVVVFCPGKGRKRISKESNELQVRDLILRAILSAPYHPSRFWRREQIEIDRHAQHARELVRSIPCGKLPHVYFVTGALPFGSVAHDLAELGCC